MDLGQLSNAIVESELDYDEKFFLLFFVTRIDFMEDIFKQNIELSHDFIAKKMGCSERHIRTITKKTIEKNYITYIKGGSKTKNSPNKYCLTEKIIEEYQEKIEQITKKEGEKNVAYMEHWHRILAQEWANWLQNDRAVRVASVEKLAFDLADASFLLKSTESEKKPIKNEEEAMRTVFDFVQINEHWMQAAMTPDKLKFKENGVARVRVIYNQATESKKNINNIAYKRAGEKMKETGEKDIEF